LRDDLREEEEEEPNQMVAQFIHQEAKRGNYFSGRKGDVAAGTESASG